MYLRISMIFIMIAIAGCASRNVGHSPESFTSYESNYCFALKEEFKYQEKRGLLGNLWDQGLRQGEYKGRYQDEDGYYYVGPENAICQEQEKCEDFGKWPGGNGGIWVSKKSENDIRIFVINDNEKLRDKYTGTSLWLTLEALVDADHGEFYIFDKNQEFVDFISLKKTTCKVAE